MDVEDLSRFQFAFTVMFHMTFPAITVGLSIFLTVIYGMYWRTHRAVYLQMFRFWKRIFAVGFALGIVSGTVITFEFGLNWGVYAAQAGPIIAPIIAMEVVTAFFLEAGFIGIMLYGDGRVKERTMFLSSLMVAIGTVLSTTWILAANSWMQTPAGYSRNASGEFVPENWAEAIFTIAFAWRYPHMLLAALLSASLFIAGISAFYLRRKQVKAFALRSFSIALGALAIIIPLQLSVGDHVAGNVVAPYQLSKLEAMEGNWDSTNTGYNVFALFDVDAERNDVLVTIPWLGSAIAKDLTGQTPTPGMLKTPVDDRPDPWTVFWGFRVMFYGSMVIFGAAMAGVVLRLRRRFETATRFHSFMMWLTPLGIIAILGGWVTAETGRQPWVVFGELRTADAMSKLAAPEVAASLSGFIVIYASLMTAYIVFIVRAVRRGPERDHPDWGEPDPDAGVLELAGDSEVDDGLRADGGAQTRGAT